VPLQCKLLRKSSYATEVKKEKKEKKEKKKKISFYGNDQNL